MGKNYPSFPPSYSHEDLGEYFLLTPGELDLVLKCRGDANRCGMALLLKTLPRLGIIHQYASEAGIEKRVYPQSFPPSDHHLPYAQRHYHPKLRLLSGHSEEKSLAIYRDLALANVAGDYETASRTFPIR